MRVVQDLHSFVFFRFGMRLVDFAQQDREQYFGLVVETPHEHT
jgi:hypothetical protein